jgi:MoxR-like ATPase
VPLLQQWFLESVAQAAPQHAPWLTRAVEAFEKQLEIERSLPAEDGKDEAGKLALARAVGGASETGMLRIVSAALEDKLRRRFSPVHVAGRVAQLDEVLARTAEHAAALQAEADALAAALRQRLWLPPELAWQMLEAKAATLATVQSLAARLAAAREGFAALPVDADAAPALPPEPVALTA